MSRTMALAFALGLSSAAASEGGGVDSAQVEFFEGKVRPILTNRCVGCHGAEKQKGGLRLDSADAMRAGGESGPALVSGKPDESLIVAAVRHEGETKMPPKQKLKGSEIDALVEWVRRGAPWPDASPRPRAIPESPSRPVTDEDRAFWSFRPVRDPVPPAVADASWPKTAVDRFILAALESKGLKPSPPADRRTLIRRVTFDLTGLPPTPDEVAAFVADPSPEAYPRLVERLLASPRYGERWARHWLDVARYGEDQAHSFEPRLYPGGYRYRDWLVAAFNADMPYDRFLVEQTAGDLLGEPGMRDRLPALGLFACGPVYYGDAKKLDQIDDRIDTLTRGVLGLTVACARCHDHKYDPIPTADYYALAGVFASTDYDEVPMAPAAQVEAYTKAKASVAAKAQEIAALSKAESAQSTKDSRVKLKALRDELALLKKNAPPMYPVAHALKEGKPTTMNVLARGNPESPGPEAPRRFLSVLGGTPFTNGSGRLELAKAVASPDNPLTARVIVNRVWQHHFGRGLVATPSNFGALGERPTHPELLDHLASRFVAGGWSVKSLHRLILLSSAYRQDSRFDPKPAEVDPENRLVWRASRRRLEVEAWRDSLLAVSGRLDSTVGGPPFRLDDPDARRRTLYAAVSRHDLAALLRLFDFPDPNITADRRPETTVPLQQLVALNEEWVIRAARSFAARVASAGDDDPSRVRRAFSLLFGRAPAEPELRLGLAYLDADDPPGRESGDLTRWERYAQALLTGNEFLYVD